MTSTGCWELYVSFERLDVPSRGPLREHCLEVFSEAGLTAVEGFLSSDEIEHLEPRLITYPEDEASGRRLTAALQKLNPKLEVVLRFLPDAIWNAVWDESLCRFSTNRFSVIPESDPKTHDGRIAIRLAPSSAFGDGRHVTTRVALALLDRLFSEGLPQSLLDVGCGNGVLAIAAALSGVGSVGATDIVDEAILSTAQNARINGVTVDLRHDQEPFDGRLWDCVVANIPAVGLIALMESLVRSLASQGTLVLSGFFAGDLPMVEKAAFRFGIAKVAVEEESGWPAVAFRRKKN